MNKQEFFDRLAASWDEKERADISERLARVVALSCLREGHIVLDVGTGTGVLIPHILRAVGERGFVVAIDISREMLRQARQKGFPPNVHLILADMHRAGFQPQVFDRVLCNAVFPHFDDKERALYEAWRVLRPGGLLVISHPIGREAVNRLHAQCQPVAEDRVPAAAKMYELLTRLGWADAEVIDEPEFYLARARKRA
mgnify:CR=1 FL=1